MEKYIINKNTLIIYPLDDNKSKIIENYISYIVNKKTLEIINESCNNYGSSYQGRCESTNFLIGVKYKCPIIISEVKEIIMFPTTSAKNNDCIWINYNLVENYYLNNNNNIVLSFKNHQKIELNVSKNIISNQILKSSRLESVLRGKKR